MPTTAELHLEKAAIICPRCGVEFKHHVSRLKLCGDCKGLLSPAERVAWI